MQYTQNTRVDIYVHKDNAVNGETQGANEKAPEESNDNGSAFLEKLTGSKSASRQKRVIKTNLTHAVAVSRQIFNNAVQYQLAGLSEQYGDQAYQQAVDRQFEQFNDTVNIATSIGMGALYGSWGGPLGAVAGAVLNGTSTAVNTAFKYKGREREFNYKLFKEENGIQYRRARASLDLTTGRLR